MDNKWHGRIFDLYYDTKFDLENWLRISVGQVGKSTEITVINLGDTIIEIKIDWYGISDYEFKKIYQVQPRQTKKITIPPLRRVTIKWRKIS